MDLYYEYWMKSRGTTCDNALTAIVPAPSPTLYIRQRGLGRPIYVFDRLAGVDGPICGDNFIAHISTGRYDELPDDVAYNHAQNIWECGDNLDPDFLFYLSRLANGGQVVHFMRCDDMVTLRRIYDRYGFECMVSVIDSLSGWCNLF